MSMELTSVSILTGVRDALVAEIVATRPPEPVTLRRDIAVIVTAALGEVIDSIVKLEAAAGVSGQLLTALAAAQVELDCLRDEATAPPAIGFNAPRRATRPDCVIIDLSEILRREARQGGGGDAA